MNKKRSFDMIVNNMDASRATKILAKSLYRELRENGYSTTDIVNFSKEVIDCIAADVDLPLQVEDKKERQLMG